MKILFYILTLIVPIIGFPQQPLLKSSPSDYIWKNVGDVGFTGDHSSHIQIAINPSDGYPYLGFISETNDSVIVLKYDGIKWGSVGNACFTSGAIYNFSLAFSRSGQLYVAFDGIPNAWGKIIVMKYDGNNWINVGDPFNSTSYVLDVSLGINPTDNQPYAAYQDGYWGPVITKKFNGNSWNDVGIGIVSSGRALNPNLTFDSTGQPYVAYADSVNHKWRLSVMRYDGTNWEYVGRPGFTEDEVCYNSLSISTSDNQPYVAYQNGHPGLIGSGGATVKKFDGFNWVNVGNANFSIGTTLFTSLAFTLNGNPIVAYLDNTNNKVTVKEFDGTAWIDVGPATGFSAGKAYYINLIISQTGQPFVAYSDVTNSFKATVMKYDSVYIGIREQQTSKFLFYPNPATDNITIDASQDWIPIQLTILSVRGMNLLIRQITEPKTQIDVSNFPAGVYFVRLTGDRTVAVGKFIKQ